MLKTQHPELCTEVPDEIAKLVVYDESAKALRCQLYIAGKQYWQIARCDGHADVVVCDSPLLLSAVYGTEYGQSVPDEFVNTLKYFHHRYPSLNYVVKRRHGYDERARVQTEHEAQRIDRKINTMLSVCDVKTNTVESTVGDATKIVNDIVRRIKDADHR